MPYIIYTTLTGNSKKIAEAIGKKLGVAPKEISENGKFEFSDTLIIVGGIYFGKNKAILKDFVSSLDANEVKQVAVVTTSGAGKHRKVDTEIIGLLKNKGIKVLGEFNVRGKAFIFPTGHPNADDLKEVCGWIEELISS